MKEKYCIIIDKYYLFGVRIMLIQDINSYDGFYYDLRVYRDFPFLNPHIHRSAEMIYVLHGEVILYINSKPHKVPQNKLALVLPNKLHFFECDSDSVFIVHVFSRDCAPEFFKLLGTRSAKSPVFECDQTGLAYYSDCFGIGEAVRDINNGAEVQIMCARPHLSTISAMYAVLGDYLESALAFDGTDNLLIEQILFYISLNSEKQLTLESISENFGYEPHYLCRLIKRYTNLNLRYLINTCRVENAKEMLWRTGYLITEIALKCGFGSLRTFNRVFLEIEKITPTEFRCRYSG